MGFAVSIWLLLPDYPKSPHSNSWLTQREDFLEARLPENAPNTHDSNFSWKRVIESLNSPLMWSFMLSQTMISIGRIAKEPTSQHSASNIGFVWSSILGVVHRQGGRAYIVRPFYVALLAAGMMVCFILFFTITDRVGIYIACILGTLLYQSFVPFWSWRSATLSGTTGAAFILGLQSGVGQLSKVISPQLFRFAWKYNAYKHSFAISMATVIAGFLTNLVTWYLTRNTECDVIRVRRFILQARKEGKVLSDNDIKIVNRRKFYRGSSKRENQDIDPRYHPKDATGSDFNNWRGSYCECILS